MKSLSLFLFALIPMKIFAGNQKPINPIIGDQSYLMKYGCLPNGQTNDQDRIQTHVSYAEFLLRTVDVSHLSEEQKARRDHTLDLLHDYWTRGKFPMNTDYITERQPCFIDDNGTICAVGYLVEQTAGREIAELISERHLYQTILEMKDPILDEWVKTTGLTLEECAIIQPSYRYEEEKHLHISYGISYRVGDNLYHSMEGYVVSTGSRGTSTKAVGITFDWLRNGNFSAGIKIAVQFRGLNRRVFRKSGLFIQPEMFRYNSAWGMNFRPGIEWKSRQDKLFAFGMSYSYLIPVIFESAYGAGRHNLTVRVSLNLYRAIELIPKKPKQDVIQPAS